MANILKRKKKTTPKAKKGKNGKLTAAMVMRGKAGRLRRRII